MDRSNYNGLFVPKDGVGAGHLSIAGKNTLLKLLVTTPTVGSGKETRDYHGFLNDGYKVSLLECVQKGFRCFSHGENIQYEFRIFPHLVLIGDKFLCSHEARIQAIHYKLENSSNFVDRLENFGTIHPTHEEFRKILEAEHNRREKIAKEQGWPSAKFDIEIGESPVMQYFSGCFHIAESQSKIGSVKLANQISYDVVGSHGVHIDNEINISLVFENPTDVQCAFKWLGVLHSFFELCLGKRQRYLSIEVELVEEGDNVNGLGTRPLQTYWSYCNEGISGETASTHPTDVLVTPYAQRTEFESVLANWLDSENRVGEARSRFTRYFRSDLYGVDRIVGSANMFDLLPDTHVPSTTELDEQTLQAVEDCRKRFKALSKGSPARQPVLTALGRVGSPSLREIVLHRARIITNIDQERFAELDLPCTQAVHCRNYFVHGTKRKFDYEKENDTFIFLTETLEFVFAMSHLIELGWDYSSWRKKGTVLSHPFGTYIHTYKMSLIMLKKILSEISGK